MAGNIDTRTEIIPANGVTKLPNANFIFVISSSASVTLQLTRAGLRPGAAQENYVGQLAGLQISRVNAWDFAAITGTPGVSITFMYGNVAIKDDATLFNQQIAVISGVTAVATQPTSTVADRPGKSILNGQASLFAANLARRRITVFSDPTNANQAVIYFRAAGGANDIGFIVPGQFIEFDGTYALDYRAPSPTGTGDVLYFFEET